MSMRTITIEDPNQAQRGTILKQLEDAQIQVVNVHQVSRWLKFEVSVDVVTQVLYLFPVRARVEGSVNLSLFKELEEHEIELLVLTRQEFAIHDIQTVSHPYSEWQWALLLNYFDESQEEVNVVLRTHKSATCEQMIFPDAGYILSRVVTERSSGCNVLMPVQVSTLHQTPFIAARVEDVFRTLAEVSFGLTGETSSLLRDYLRIMRERTPQVCGMAFDVSGSEPYIGYWDKIDVDDLAAWSQVNANEHPNAQYFLWQKNGVGHEGEALQTLPRAQFFTQLYSSLKDPRPF